MLEAMTMGIPQPFFRVLINTNSVPDQLKVRLAPSGRILTPDAAHFIQEKWDQFPQERSHPDDLKPSRIRFEQILGGTEAVEAIEIAVSLGVSYRDSWVARTFSHNYIDQFGKESAPLDLAVTGLGKASDGKLILTHRQVADYKKGGWHLSGAGFLTFKLDQEGNPIPNSGDLDHDGVPVPLKAMLRETTEETGISEEEIEDIRFRGAVAIPHQGEHVNLIYTFTTPLESGKVAIRAKEKGDRENKLIFIDDKPETVTEWIRRFSHAGVASGLATLVLYGRDRYGEAWYNSVNQILKSQMKAYVSHRGYILLEQRDINRLRRALADKYDSITDVYYI